MEQFSSNIPSDMDELEATFTRYLYEQRSNMGFGKELSYQSLRDSQGISDMLGLSFDDPEEFAEVPQENTIQSSTNYPTGKRPSAWGGYSNGRLPLSALKAIGKRSTRTAEYKGFHWLRPDAADAWLKLMEHARKDGVRLTVTSAYRTYNHQASIGGGRAAKPGRSPHGWALAVDIAELYFSGSRAQSVAGSARMRQTPTYKWMDRVGRQYGWENPPLLRDGRSLDESWHWEFVG